MIRKTLLTILFILFISTAASSQWVQQTFVNGFNLFSASFPSVNTGFACGYGNYLIKTTNGGTNWIDISFEGTASNLNAVFFVNENTGWLCSTDTLFYTTNCGVNWITKITPIYGRELFFINENTGWLSTGGNFLKTIDGGLNWSTISFLSDGYMFFINALTGWTTRSAGGNTIIYKSTDGGLNWNFQFMTTDFHYIYAFDFVNENTGWASGYRETILKTTNGGVNWEFQRDIAGSNGLYSIDFVNENTGWAAGDIMTGGARILSTTNGGLNWNQSTLPASGRLSKVQFVNSSTGWIVGHNNRVFKTTNTGGITAVTATNNSLPEKFVLYQNYPNPFNPVTMIKFEAPLTPPEGGMQIVSLKIYDLLGREISSLFSSPWGRIGGAAYETEWNASDYPSGVYYYRLVVTDASSTQANPLSIRYSETKKMILLK